MATSAPDPSPLAAAVSAAARALARGFDAAADARLLYCKGSAAAGLLRRRAAPAAEVRVSSPAAADPLLLPVPGDVAVLRLEGEGVRETFPVLPFPRMAEHFNKLAGLSGHVPLGSFNSMFSFTGPWRVDAATTKALAVDSYYIPLYKVQLVDSDLNLSEDVKRAIPRTWEPSSLASFIENFGTHVITSVTIGGQDVVYVKQHHSSPLSEAEIEKYVKSIGDQKFSEAIEHPDSGVHKLNDRIGDSSVLEDREIHPQSSSASHLSAKEDITVIFRRRGGDDLVQSLGKWAETVILSPDIINMTFVPITSLLDGLPGSKHLVRAIELYLEYKPSIEELQYFLDFQIQHVWAPEQINISRHPRKEPVCPSLQFSLFGPKLYISSEQITVGRKPVTGFRLSLEGSKQNRLTIHIQHLASLPKILQPHWDSHVAIGPPRWQGPEEQDSRWFEPIKYKNFAHVSTAPIENTETTIGDLSGVHVVTGAQLGVWDFGVKSVLHLKLLFSKIPGCTIRRSVWDHSPLSTVKAEDMSSSSNENRVPDEQKADSGQAGKLAKLIDFSEICKGPQDLPGHWLVTGAKLGIEKGKIVVRVKYSILNY